ncbi:SMI1/KNR4 family protein [Hymenobacter psoromatis]|uniref:SMI1/KNR4 family protein n=1 Tax=Hymenobacter psoromatis TaxID=1484116 RepID=UPI001CBEB86D|nr:SMI1/KNR4 family protein [Hymenobacter psoromatis]
MKENIKELNEKLSTLRPEFYVSLQQPLAESEINSLEEKYKMQIPSDLSALYKWKNGQVSDCYESFVNNSMFIPLEQALAIAAENTSMIGYDFEVENWWNEKWIPIFHNGGGDYICYDLGGIFTGQQGQLLEFWHADNDRNIIAPNLEAFISKINYFYNTKQKQEFDEYFQIENIDGYPQEFTVE